MQEAPPAVQKESVGGPSIEIHYVGWDVVTTYRFGREDVIRSALGHGKHVCLHGGDKSRELLSLLGKPAAWRNAADESRMDLRLLIVLRADGVTDTALFADRFHICSDVTGTCRELDRKFQDQSDAIISGFAESGEAVCP